MLNVRYQSFAIILMAASFANDAGANARQAYLYPETKSTVKAVKDFFGNMSGSYYIPNSLIYHQVLLGMSVPNDIVKMDNGFVMESGCRPHSCLEKAAIIKDEKDNVISAAIVSYKCHRIKTGATGCLSAPILTLFNKRHKFTPSANKVLINWYGPSSSHNSVEYVKI